MEKPMTNDEYFKSLSESEWGAAAAAEAEIHAFFQIVAAQGLSEETAVGFVRTLFAVRKDKPEATVEGVFEVALKTGLWYVTEIAKPGPATPKKSRGKLSGAGR